jgi:hypothetical protein
VLHDRWETNPNRFSDTFWVERFDEVSHNLCDVLWVPASRGFHAQALTNQLAGLHIHQSRLNAGSADVYSN